MIDKLLAEDLERTGCPYGIDDPRARVWLEGYSAAIDFSLATSASLFLDRMAGEAE